MYGAILARDWYLASAYQNVGGHDKAMPKMRWRASSEGGGRKSKKPTYPGTEQGVELWAGEEDEPCSLCGNMQRCMRLVDTKEQVYAAAFCGHCLAVALEALTGHAHVAQYENWQQWRALKVRTHLAKKWREV